MIDFNILAYRVQRKCHCNREDALSALAEAYIACDKTRSESEQAQYMYISACYTRLDHVSRTVKSTQQLEDLEYELAKARRRSDDPDEVTVEDLCVSQDPIEDDGDFLIDITKHLSPEYKVAVICVAHSLLTSTHIKRQPLSVEMTRQLLKRHGIPNTSEMARQVYTFLTTLRSIL